MNLNNMFQLMPPQERDSSPEFPAKPIYSTVLGEEYQEDLSLWTGTATKIRESLAQALSQHRQDPHVLLR